MKRECIIRPYEKSDIPYMVKTVSIEVPKLPTYKDITVSQERVEYLLTQNHGNVSFFQSWVLIDAETQQLVGGAGGYCAPGMLTWDLVANDVFLFVDPEWRSLRNCVMLIVAYVKWAKARNAKLIMASQTSGYRMDAFAEVMRRQGFMETGRQWMLRMD